MPLVLPGSQVSYVTQERSSLSQRQCSASRLVRAAVADLYTWLTANLVKAALFNWDVCPQEHIQFKVAVGFHTLLMMDCLCPFVSSNKCVQSCCDGTRWICGTYRTIAINMAGLYSTLHYGNSPLANDIKSIFKNEMYCSRKIAFISMHISGLLWRSVQRSFNVLLSDVNNWLE